LKKLNTLESVGLGRNDFKGIANREHDAAQLTLEKCGILGKRKAKTLDFEEVDDQIDLSPDAVVLSQTVDGPVDLSQDVDDHIDDNDDVIVLE